MFFRLSVGFVVCVLLPSLVLAATNVCSCECCDAAGRCLRARNTTFSIDSCGDCTKDECISKYVDCHNAVEIVSKCFNRNAFWNVAIIWIFLITVASLIILGILKERIPWLAARLKTN